MIAREFVLATYRDILVYILLRSLCSLLHKRWRLSLILLGITGGRATHKTQRTTPQASSRFQFAHLKAMDMLEGCNQVLVAQGIEILQGSK